MTNKSTYLCEYSILPERTTRDTCITFFGGMSYEDDLNELGEINLLGRWAVVGEAKGFCVVEANNTVDLQKWLNNWVSMADIKVTPCLDDNLHREFILGKCPEYKVVYDKVNQSALENESLYFLKYKFKADKREEGFEVFANMTEEQDLEDAGNCTCYGRWHDPSDGSGFAVASSPDVLSLFKWARNWKELCDVSIYPVTDDLNSRMIIQQSYGFDAKYNIILNELLKLNQPPAKKCF